jgi:molybdenum-dependent DNA-binding transcriptional regulator ModE
MVNSNKTIIKNKVGLSNLTQELGNISKACKVMGFSRDTFYRYQEAVEQGGVEALVNKSKRGPKVLLTRFAFLLLKAHFS